MAVSRAKILDDNQLDSFLDFIGTTSLMPERDRVMVLLNYKAGLRAAEISGLQWKDVTDAVGNIGQEGSGGLLKFTVPSNIAKMGHERDVPLHPLLFDSITALRKCRYPGLRVITGSYTKKINGIQKSTISPNAVAQFLRRLYVKAGLQGCSSHSGRRTFITKLARAHNLHDCSLKDVQTLAGHKNLQTTEIYIEPSINVSKLISSI